MISSEGRIEEFISFIKDNKIKFNINNMQKGEILYNFCTVYCKEVIEQLTFIWMKNGLSFKVAPGSLSLCWISGDQLANPLSDTKSAYYTYRYIETGNKRMWFL